jgi:hypothetical protein
MVIVSRQLLLRSTATRAALPAMSLAPVAPLYLGSFPLRSTATRAALPAMSVAPVAPFAKEDADPAEDAKRNPAVKAFA